MSSERFHCDSGLKGKLTCIQKGEGTEQWAYICYLWNEYSLEEKCLQFHCSRNKPSALAGLLQLWSADRQRHLGDGEKCPLSGSALNLPNRDLHFSKIPRWLPLEVWEHCFKGYTVSWVNVELSRYTQRNAPRSRAVRLTAGTLSSPSESKEISTQREARVTISCTGRAVIKTLCHSLVGGGFFLSLQNIEEWYDLKWKAF